MTNHLDNGAVCIPEKPCMGCSKIEINYFDTPHDRRNGNEGMANFMGAILTERAERPVEERRAEYKKETGYEFDFSEEEIYGEPTSSNEE